MNAYANAGLSRDFPEPDYSAEAMEDAHNDAVGALVDRYWRDASVVEEALSEGIKVPNSVCGLICDLRKARIAQARGQDFDPVAVGEVLTALIDAIDDALDFAADVEVTREELARDEP